MEMYNYEADLVKIKKNMTDYAVLLTINSDLIYDTFREVFMQTDLQINLLGLSQDNINTFLLLQNRGLKESFNARLIEQEKRFNDLLVKLQN